MHLVKSIMEEETPPKRAMTVRFDEDVLKQLDQISRRSRTSPAHLIRLAVDRLIYHASSEGELIIPLSPEPAPDKNGNGTR